MAEDFAAEQRLLPPLPGEPFDTGTVLWPRADRFARISVGKCRYSVPARLIGTRVRVRLTANELGVFDGSRQAAVHPRLTAAGAEHLELDHYLEILVRKPGALPGSVPLAQARAAGVFTAAHEAFWAAARARHGDGPGTRALIEVLLLHRRMPGRAGDRRDHRGAGARGPAPRTWSRSRPASTPRGRPARAGRRRRRWPAAGAMPAGAAVITLPRRRAPLPPDGRPAPSVAAYDQLLARPGGKEARDERHGVMS